MAEVNVARGLQVGSDERALTFAELDTQVSKSFKDANLMMAGGYIKRKTLGPGASSHDFPQFGQMTNGSGYHIPGALIQGGTLTHAKVNVSLDDPYIAALWLALEDNELAAWDLFQPYAEECGRINAELIDSRAHRLIALAARTAAVSNVHLGGTRTQRIAATVAAAYPVSSTGADNFCADLADEARALDDKFVPRVGRVAFITPYMAQVLTRSNRVVNRDYTNGQINDILNREIAKIEGFSIVLSNKLPSTSISTDLSKYNGDFTTTPGAGTPVALINCNTGLRSAVGMVEVAGMRNTITWDETRESWLIKSRMRVGMGKVDVWTAGEIYVTTA